MMDKEYKCNTCLYENDCVTKDIDCDDNNSGYKRNAIPKEKDQNCVNCFKLIERPELNVIEITVEKEMVICSSCGWWNEPMNKYEN